MVTSMVTTHTLDLVQLLGHISDNMVSQDQVGKAMVVASAAKRRKAQQRRLDVVTLLAVQAALADATRLPRRPTAAAAPRRPSPAATPLAAQAALADATRPPRRLTPAATLLAAQAALADATRLPRRPTAAAAPRRLQLLFLNSSKVVAAPNKQNQLQLLHPKVVAVAPRSLLLRLTKVAVAPNKFQFKNLANLLRAARTANAAVQAPRTCSIVKTLHAVVIAPVGAQFQNHNALAKPLARPQ